jgi:branched-chain amino acid transport system substrate-binding protein
MVRRRSHKAIVFLTAGAVAVVLTGCGSRLSAETLYADAQRANTPLGSGTTTATGSADTAAGSAGAVGSTGSVGSAATGGTAAGPTGGAATAPGAGTGTGSGTKEAATAGGTVKADVSAKTPTGAQPCTGVKSTITIGTVGIQSGFVGTVTRGGVDAIRAGVAAANASGGINCHPIKYVVKDDGGNPSLNQSQAAELVEQDKIIAQVFQNNPFSGKASFNYLNANKVPVIGGEGGGEYFHESPYYYPVAASGADLYRSSFGMLSTTLTAEQKKNVGVVSCIEAEVCSQFASAQAIEYAKSVGLTVVFTTAVSLTQPDYSSTCQSAQRAKAQALFVIGDGSMVSRTVRSCAGINYKPQFASTLVSSAPDVALDPNMQGVLWPSTVMPWTVTSNPTVKDYVGTLSKYIPGAQPSGSGVVGWASWLVFRHALEQVTSENPTRADLYNELNKIKNLDFNGFTAPLTYAAGQNHLGPLCWWTMKTENKVWSSTDNGRRYCARVS